MILNHCAIPATRLHRQILACEAGCRDPRVALFCVPKSDFKRLGRNRAQKKVSVIKFKVLCTASSGRTGDCAEPLWCCGAVVQWCRGAVVQWCRGAVVPWCRGAVAPWCCDVVIVETSGAVVMKC